MMQSHYASQTKLIIYNVCYFSAKEQEIIFSNNKNVNTSVSLSTVSHPRPCWVQGSDSTRSPWSKWGKTWVPYKVRDLYQPTPP